MSVICFNCQNEIHFSDGENISRQESCPSCYASIHSCKMCKFFDTASYNECREPMANRVTDKEKANFCDYFKIGGLQDKGPSKADLLSAADSLFKK